MQQKNIKFYLILLAIFFLFSIIEPGKAENIDIKLKLPFPSGESWSIAQGYGCDGWNSPKCTHKSSGKDAYAIDFNFGEGNEDMNKPLLAIANGVAYIRTQKEDGELVGYGQYVDIDHDNGLISRYAHLLSYSIKDGEYVKQGQEIGRCDNTGYRGGSHLHFAMYQKQPDGKLTAYKPEPMSGYGEGQPKGQFLAGNWYVSDNQIYNPNQTYAQSGDAGSSQSSQEINRPWWQRTTAAIGDFLNKAVQPIIHFAAQIIQPAQTTPSLTGQVNNQQQSVLEIWSAEIVSQSEKNLALQPGQTATLSITLKNTGNQIWKPNHQVSVNVFNQISKNIYHSSWPTRLRPSISNSEVNLNQTAQFSFSIQAPNEPGVYSPSFQLVYASDGSSFKQLGSQLISWQITVEKPFSSSQEYENVDSGNQGTGDQGQNQNNQGNNNQPPATENNQGQIGAGGGGTGGTGGTGGGMGGQEEPSDTTPPETTLITDGLSQITNSPNIFFQFLSNESNSTFQCRIDDLISDASVGASWSACASPKNYTNLSEGQHNFEVRAIDSAGNIDLTSVSFPWTIDLTGPISNIDPSFDQAYFNVSSWSGKIFGAATGNASSTEDLAKVKILVQKGLGTQYLGYASSTLAWLDEPFWLETILNETKTSWQRDLPVNLLSDENYIVKSRAVDVSGNLQNTSSTVQFIFDATPPSKPDGLKINRQKDSLEMNLAWNEASGDLSGIDFYQIRWPAEGQENTTSTQTVSFRLTGQDKKEYKFKLWAIDKAGNRSLEASEAEHFVRLPSMVISEIQIAGQNIDDEFIELFNSADQDINLTGYKIKKKDKNGEEKPLVAVNKFKDKIIKANGHLLLARQNNYLGQVMPDIWWSKSNYLAADNTIILYNDQDQIIDKVGWGQAIDFEKQPAQEPAANQSLERKSDTNYVYQDVDDNSQDFLIQTAPNPQNSGDIYIGPLLYSENFDSNQAQDWTTFYTYDGGAWRIDPIPGVTWDASQGQYRLIVPAKDQGSKSIYQGGYDWRDYTFSLDVALNDGVDRNIFFRYQDSQNYYSLGLRGFWRYASNDTPVIYLAKCYQGVCSGHFYWKYFAAYHFSNPQALNNEVAQIKIKAVGGQIQVFYNENLIIDYIETKENYSTNGTIGFSGWSGHYPRVDVGFDNLMVREE